MLDAVTLDQLRTFIAAAEAGSSRRRGGSCCVMPMPWPMCRVVKAFNHLDVAALVKLELSGGQRVLFYSGDDAAAKTEVRTLIENTGFFPVDLGSLTVGGQLAGLPFGSLSAINFVKI